MVMRRFVIALLVLTGLLAFDSCHKELCYQHPHSCDVKVVFDWMKAPEANPATMSQYLYPLHTDEVTPMRYEFKGRDGGMVTVPEGSFSSVGLNSDIRLLSVSEGTSPEEILVTTAGNQPLKALSLYGVSGDNLPRAEGTATERMAASADRFYTGSLVEFAVSRKDKEKTIVIYPDEATCRIRVEIRNVENFDRLMASGAAITTLAGSFIPWSFSATNEKVTVPFDLVPDAENTRLTGSIYSFGCPSDCDAAPVNHTLSVYAIMDDGERVWFNIDVTDRIHNAPDPHDILIVIDHLPLPSEPAYGGGFSPVVNPWREITIGITM